MFTSPDASRRSFNGYHLLNEVSTGGTLTSLFSILTLFTEDIKLSWSPPESDSESEDDEDDEDGVEGDNTVTSNSREENGLRRNKSRANSDVSQMADDTLGKRMSSPEDLSSMSSGNTAAEESRSTRPRSASTGTIHIKTQPGNDQPTDAAISVPGTTSASPVIRSATKQTSHEASEIDLGASSAPESPKNRSRGRSFRSQPKLQESQEKAARQPKHGNTGSKAFKGTIARATTDTTLAVIPAEAFRKLTRKFPKASGTVVQVVLERFSRVTFMTGRFGNCPLYSYQLTNTSVSPERS